MLEDGNTYVKQYIKQHSNKNSNEPPFLIDCKEMERIDSAGIALLLEWQRQFKNTDLTCLFKDLSKQAQSLITTYRLQSLIAA